MGNAGGVTGLLIGRSITGIAAAGWVPLVVAFNSLFPPKEIVRATAILTLFYSLGRLVGTASTGMLNNWGGYSLPFLLAVGVAGLGIIVMLPTREMHFTPVRRSRAAIKGLILRRDVLLPALLSAVTMYADISTTFGFFPILAVQLGGNYITQSMLVTVYMVIFIIGNLSTPFLIKRVSSQTMLTIAFILLGVGIGTAAVATTLPLLFAGQFFIGVAMGINYPVLMGLSIRKVSPAEQNTAMGLHQSVYAIGIFVGPWVSGMLADAVGLSWMLGITAVGVVLLGMYGIMRLPDYLAQD
jgi:DHA1 family multidrug resistance protein-like MFS transporter